MPPEEHLVLAALAHESLVVCDALGYQLEEWQACVDAPEHAAAPPPAYCADLMPQVTHCLRAAHNFMATECAQELMNMRDCVKAELVKNANLFDNEAPNRPCMAEMSAFKNCAYLSIVGDDDDEVAQSTEGSTSLDK